MSTIDTIQDIRTRLDSMEHTGQQMSAAIDRVDTHMTVAAVDIRWLQAQIKEIIDFYQAEQESLGTPTLSEET